MTAKSLFTNPLPDAAAISEADFMKLLDIQQDMLRSAVTCSDTKSLLDQLCLRAEKVTTQAIATIMLTRKAEQKLYLYAGPNVQNAAADELNGLKVGEGSCGNVVHHGEEMFVCNTLEDARWENHRSFAEKFTLLACWSAPIRNAQGQVIGSFALTSFERRKPNNMHRKLLQICASIASMVFQRQIDQKKGLEWEHEAARREKLESLGVLAGGIAHDFNNLLGIISGNLDLALRSLSSADKEHAYLTASQQAGTRAAELTQQLLTFSKGGSPLKEAHELQEIVRQSAKLALHSSNVALKYESATQAPMTVQVDKTQMSLVIQNIVLNARQAMEAGGTVTIRFTENVPYTDLGEDRFETFHRIDISDQGAGISEDMIDRIFDPYFTTKSGGSGLGLAMSYSIVEKHKGHILVNSAPGEGATFSLFIPVSDTEIIQEVVTTSPNHSDKGIAIIMDDEALLREVLAAMLTDIGFEVLAAEEGQQAINLFRDLTNQGQKVSLIVLDLTVPGGMGGKDAVTELLKIDATANVVVCSGYSNDSVISDHGSFGFKAALSKPYTYEELEAVVTSLID